MRLCLYVHEDNQTCETLQPAEPLLAEAAFDIIQTKKIDQAKELLDVLCGPSISKGDRGEFICTLLWLLARDDVVLKNRSPTGYGKARSVIKVVDLMKALLAQKWHSAVMDAEPSCLKDQTDKSSFQNLFKDAVAYFTQFIKVQDFQVINRAYLWMALARGAAILCANNQGGLDILIPFEYHDELLAKKHVSAIIIQVKNDATYGAKPHRVLFHLMNPYRIGFYDTDEEETVPVIRMVFALAATDSNVHVMAPPERQQPPRKASTKSKAPRFTSFDIWCAKASKETFSGVQSDDTFVKLLSTQKKFPESYKSNILDEELLRRQMHPMALAKEEHWLFGKPFTRKNRNDDLDWDDDELLDD